MAAAREVDGIRITLRLVTHRKDFRLYSEFNENKLLEGFQQ